MAGRSAGRLFKAGRLRRGIAEFLPFPLLMTAAFCAVAVLVASLDRREGAPALRAFAGRVVPASSATEFVGVVAASLMTVTSITFPVLLIAVQQTASSLGAVVFDQYLRRRANQAYAGYFVGATAFSFVVLAFGDAGSPPVLGAFAALLLTVGSLVALLLLIHSTVDQMRPECVVSSIHELALRAHEGELRLLAGTRRERRSEPGSQGRDVPTPTGGYVVSIDARALAGVAGAAGPGAEVLLPCQLGTYLASGETVATIVGVAAQDDRFDARTLSAVAFDDTRRVEMDSGYSIAQLETIAWTTATSAQSPYTAGAAIHQLRDLVARWSAAEEDARTTALGSPEPLPVVYATGAIERVVRGLGELLTASSQSRQSSTAALLVTSFAHALPRLRTDYYRDQLLRSLDAALPSLTAQVGSPALVDALAGLEDALAAAGRSTRGVRQVRAVLRAATEDLIPDPSTLHELRVAGGPGTSEAREV